MQSNDAVPEISDFTQRTTPSFRFLCAYWLVGQALVARVESTLQNEEKMDLRELIVLSYLAAGTSYPSEVAQHILLPKYEVSRTLDRLLKKGLIERQVDEKDARRMQFRVTHAGLEAQLRALELTEDATSPLLMQLQDTETFVNQMEMLSQLAQEDLK
ncbi:MarR family winged helix-turn-helix transcriptional regulator [Deinococcus cellulosilyticus]|uniref:HTH marR-type domain-containing protein n=1 Tax=Deinococcus cellulosilyticus (strain DSM 18568 / NBRC 106333 / KACC 11606 / 5516J-15) TaxID=1223518 RepID=A0A511MZ06_DEIC1|nr:MarR family transcriptional regulator [Deinococcus cellulosilyticus]GEM45845.1 hypothetical protein DC3_14800 [Deinococcus cellulosilyticus NBRC 106333 = KACC 11606]